MRKMRWRAALFCLVALCLAAVGLGGCGGAKPVPSQPGAYLSVTDDAGRAVALAKKPVRIVALSPSFLEPLGAVDAKLVGRPSSKTGVPAFAEALPAVGAVYNINVEQVVALQPDLVLAYQGMHDKLVPLLESNGIPVLVLRFKTYEDVTDKVRLFARIADAEAKGEAIVSDMQAKIQRVLARLPKQTRRVAILHSTAKSVTVELEGSIAGCTAQLLGLENVAAGSKAFDKDPDSTPYSLETLVERNPELIFVTTMGKLEEIEKRMLADVKSNPAWNSLAAVQREQVHFLPQDLFLLNPGLRYPEAVEAMARAAYPEAFGDGK